jgi:hypothetical protein
MFERERRPRRRGDAVLGKERIRLQGSEMAVSLVNSCTTAPLLQNEPRPQIFLKLLAGY